MADRRRVAIVLVIVASPPIRLRILKGRTSKSSLPKRCGCIASDPIEDTESQTGQTRILGALKGCIASDPIEDTERERR